MTVWFSFISTTHFAPRSSSAKTLARLRIKGMRPKGCHMRQFLYARMRGDPPRPLKGRTRTTTLMLPPPPGAILTGTWEPRGLGATDTWGSRGYSREGIVEARRGRHCRRLEIPGDPANTRLISQGGAVRPLFVHDTASISRRYNSCYSRRGQCASKGIRGAVGLGDLPAQPNQGRGAYSRGSRRQSPRDREALGGRKRAAIRSDQGWATSGHDDSSSGTRQTASLVGGRFDI